MPLRAVPVERTAAGDFVDAMHRHHQRKVLDKYRVGAMDGDKLVGVVQVGRPVARGLDDGKTVEVTRLCTDGTKNACSFLYSRAARIAGEMGYKRIITYILETERGDSLRAAGWHFDAAIKGKSWDTPSRHRVDKGPICDKQRWCKELQQ